MMIRTSALLVTIAIQLAACGRDQPRQAPPSRPALAAATQADLAREVDDAERRGTWREVRAKWEGQRLRWTVTRYKPLCSTASSCNVAPFPIQRPAQYGWLPALSFASGEFAKLEAACGKADRCELQFEGTLSTFVLSADLPVSLRFAEVRIVDAHAS